MNSRDGTPSSGSGTSYSWFYIISALYQRLRHLVSYGAGSSGGSTLPNGVYYIVNARTGVYAALLDNNDRSEVVNITFGLYDDGDRGSKVANHAIRRYENGLQRYSG